MTTETQDLWCLFCNSEVGIDYFTTHAEAIEEADRRVTFRHYFLLPPRTYSVFKRRNN